MHKSKFWQVIKIMVPYLCIATLAIAILYPQFRLRVYLAGYDSWFHMNQFYDTAMQFKTGNFSYFLSLFGFGGIGRIVNAVYGPGFVYLGGLILLLAKTWFRFEIVQDFLGLTLGGIFFYVLLRKNYVNRLTSTLISFLYMMSNVVMTWVINQEFNGVEAILMPLIILQGTQMARTKKIHPLALGLTMAIAFQTHMMTTLTGTLTLIPFFIYTWIKSARKLRLWKHLLMSIGLMILLTANVWGAMLNVLPQGVVPPVPQNGLTPGYALVWIGHGLSVIGFGYTVIIGCFIIVSLLSLFMWSQSSSLYKLITLLSFLWIWIASAYFPWSTVSRIYPAFRYQIQFPKRFLCVGIILLFLAVGMLFSNSEVTVLSSYGNRRLLLGAQLALIAFVIIGFSHQRSLFQRDFNIYHSSQVIDYNPFHTYHDNKKLAHRLRVAYHSPEQLGAGINLVHQDTPDYLPTNRKIQTYDQYRHSGLYSGIERQVYGDIRYLHIKKTPLSHQLTMTWRQRHAAYGAVLPVTKYRDTQVVFDHRLLKNPSTSRIGMTKVNFVPKGQNRISITYRIPVWLHILMWLTALSWLGVLIKWVNQLSTRFRSYK